MMNTKSVSSLISVTGLLVAALLLASFQTAGATHTAAAVLAYPSESTGVTRSLARVFMEPDDSSRLVEVISPGKQVRILGLNKNGAWIAIAKEDQVSLEGWLATGDVSQNIIVGTTRSLTIAYQQPDYSSAVVEAFPPEAKVKVLGHNPDNTWIAIARSGMNGTSISWVNTGDLKLPEVTATTLYLTKFYLLPDSSSRTTNVLPPYDNVLLIGSNSSATWYAVEDMRGKQFIGWTPAEYLSVDSNPVPLPVLPVH